MRGGLEIEEFWFIEGESFLARNLPQGEKFITINEYHGEYDLDWIAHVDKDNKEVLRYNAKLVAGIRWKRS